MGDRFKPNRSYVGKHSPLPSISPRFDLVPEADKGVRFTRTQQFRGAIDQTSAVIDVTLVLAAASEEGLSAMGKVLAASGRSSDDSYLWGAVKFLADRLPDSDPDAIAFSRVLRTREGIANAAEMAVAAYQLEHEYEDPQMRLL
jgi:putative DNA methylase